MSYIWFVAFSFSIFIAAAISWVRLKKIAPAFYPFILCITLAAINEVISLVLSFSGHSTMVNNNIYVLGESLLLSIQLERWNAWGNNRRFSLFIIPFLLVTWCAENIFFLQFQGISSYFRFLYSALIVFLSINVSNRLIATETGNLLRQPMFIICIGMIVYFSYKILVEAFWLYGLGRSAGFRQNVYSIMIWINLIVNILYAIAVLWIPRKQRFTMQY
jgi:hypothetical protein